MNVSRNLSGGRDHGAILAVLVCALVIAGGVLAGDGFGRPWAGSAITAVTCNGVNATIVGTDASETITGTAGNDVIAALGGTDVVDGGDGADVICPGLGNDTVAGGPGVDTLSYAESSAAVTATLATGKVTGQGTDTVSTVENVVGSPLADKLTGDGNANALSGGGQSDVVDGGAGNDALDGGAAQDTVSFASSSSGITANLATGTATGAGNDSLAGFENLAGSPANDTLTGDSSANVLEGDKGNDILDGGAGVDTVSFASSTVGVNVNLTAGTATGAGNDTLANLENVVATLKADTLVGSAAANALDAGKGTDTCRPGNGADTVSNCEVGSGPIEAIGVVDTYSFAAKANAGYFADSQSPPGSDCGNLRWGLSGPSGSIFSDVSQCSDRGPLTLTKKGTYTLTIGSAPATPGTGSYEFKLWPVPAPKTFAYTLGNIVSNGKPSAGAGNIETPGVTDIYSFSGAAGQKVFYDALSDSDDSCQFERHLLSPANVEVMGGLVCDNTGAVTLPASGTYKLRIHPRTNEDEVGTYSFRITDVPAPQSFAYTVGNVVSNGVPAAGAGNIELPQAEDRYTFSGTAGERIFYDSLADSDDECDFQRTLLSPSNTVVPGGDGFVCQDVSSITLPATGTYTLRVYPSVDRDDVGTYSFKITVESGVQTFAYTIGTVVSNGVPGPGAGNIESLGAQDHYTFTGAAGDKVFYDSLSGPNDNCAFERHLLSPSNAEVLGGFVCQDNGPITLPANGTYTLKIHAPANIDETGTYSFKITKITGLETFPYTIGNTVSNGVPAPGAGNIENPGAEDDYTFSGTAGQKVFYDSLADSDDTCSFARQLLSPSNAEVLGGFVCQDNGPFTLPATGTYKLRIFPVPNSNDTGTYSFRITSVPAPQTFAYTIGNIVSNGVPAVGAGNIEAVGGEDRYTFAGTAGQKVFYNSLSGSDDTCQFERHLLSPSNAEVMGGFVCQDTGPITLPATGTYTLRIVPALNRSDVGTYSFHITDVPAAQSFSYAIGDTVSNGVPAAGAGNIEVPQAEDRYTFSGTAGQKVFYDSLADSGDNCNFERHLMSPSNSEVLGGFVCQDNGTFTLPATGTYTLRIVPTANRADIGTYSFRIVDVPAPQTFAYTIGTTVSNGSPFPGAGNIEAIGGEDRYTFSGTAGQVISYDGIGVPGGNCNFQRTLMSPSNTVVPGADAWVCQDAASITLPATGTYTLRIYPSANRTDTGFYSFKITSP